jgi:hypothetical protein
MSRFFVVTGWIIAAVAAGAAVFFAERSFSFKEKSTQLESRLSSVANESAGRSNRDSTEIAALKKRIRELSAYQAHASKLPSNPEEVKSSSTAALPPAPPTSAPEAGSADGVDPAETTSGQSPKPGKIAEALSKQVGGEMVKSSANIAYRLQYEQFFKKLKLTADQEAQIKEIMTRNLSEMMADGFSMFGSVPAQDSERLAAVQQKLRDELSGVLNGDQMAQWDKYSEQMPEQMLVNLMDSQLEKYVPELNAESRTRATQVMMEEMKAIRDAGGANSQMSDILQAGLDRTRDRLSQEFSPEQMEPLDRFFSQQGQAIQRGLQVLNSMTGRL